MLIHQEADRKMFYSLEFLVCFKILKLSASWLKSQHGIKRSNSSCSQLYSHPNMAYYFGALTGCLFDDPHILTWRIKSKLSREYY